MSNLITINSIQRRMAKEVPLGKLDESLARRMWWAALDTLQDEILTNIDLRGGIWLASPLPSLYQSNLLKSLKGWVWSPDGLDNKFTNIGLLPPSSIRSINQKINIDSASFKRLPLRIEDGNDPFLLIITSEVQIALALHGNKGQRSLLIRSDYETLKDIFTMLLLRLEQEGLSEAIELKIALKNFFPFQTNRPEISDIFWPLVSEKLAVFSPSLNIQTLPEKSNLGKDSEVSNSQISLLEAITHEVRTPLATIRTLIRSLIRRKDISKEILNRLQQIDSECTEQIDRFGLIFRAAELERKKSKNAGLARTDLGNMLETMYPVWNHQLERRGLKLTLEVAEDLPNVLSDPEQLELMLGGLIDRNSRGLKRGDSLFLGLTPAGHRLKLQIFAKSSKPNELIGHDSNSELGAVLSWNPNTGSLQLSQGATQKLLASLGGRLTHRKEKGLTVFFPISQSN